MRITQFDMQFDMSMTLLDPNPYRILSWINIRVIQIDTNMIWIWILQTHDWVMQIL